MIYIHLIVFLSLLSYPTKFYILKKNLVQFKLDFKRKYVNLGNDITFHFFTTHLYIFDIFDHTHVLMYVHHKVHTLKNSIKLHLKY